MVYFVQREMINEISKDTSNSSQEKQKIIYNAEGEILQTTFCIEYFIIKILALVKADRSRMKNLQLWFEAIPAQTADIEHSPFLGITLH